MPLRLCSLHRRGVAKGPTQLTGCQLSKSTLPALVEADDVVGEVPAQLLLADAARVPAPFTIDLRFFLRPCSSTTVRELKR